MLDLETLGVTAFRLSADGIAAASPKLHRCLAAAIFGRHPGLRTAETADATPRRQADYGLPSQLDTSARAAAAARKGGPQVAHQMHLEVERGLDLGSAFHAYSLAALLEVRDTVWPVGVHLATLFGFQAAQPASAAADAPAVPSSLDNQVDPLSAHHSPLTTRYYCYKHLLLITNWLLLTTHHSLLTTYLDNQVDHLSKLIKNTMDRLDSRTGYLPAFQAAVGEVHGQVLGNYTHWVEHVGLSGAHLPAAIPLGGFFTTIGSLTASKWDTTGLFAFATAEEEQRWLCTAQLHQLVLWQLVWGEAANLRHAPEMIACLFHCAANAVKLPPQTPPLRPGSTALYLLPGSSMPYPPSDFLDSVVRPVYLFLRREVLERREEPVGERVMYDDVNEFFWYKDRLRLLVSDDLLRDPQRLHEAYGHMRLTLSSGGVTLSSNTGSGGGGDGGTGGDSGSGSGSGGDGGSSGDGGGGSGSGDGRAGGATGVPQEGAAARLSRLFHKSFCERTTWLNVVHIFYRVYLLHSLMLHLSVVLAFVGWEPTHLASISLTHAAWKTLRQLVEMRVGHSPRGADSVTVGGGASVGGNRLQTSHAVHICAYLTAPSVLAVEWLWRKVHSTTHTQPDTVWHCNTPEPPDTVRHCNIRVAMPNCVAV